MTSTRKVVSTSRSRWPLRWPWTVLVALLAVLFVVLRGISAAPDVPTESAIFTEQVVVVGVTGRPALTDADRAVLGANLAGAQVGAVSVRPRYVGDCAAAGWATLGAGRRTSVGSDCNPEVRDGRVVDWAEWTAAAADRRGDARLGTLAGTVPGCVAAVGPGAALAAARPDGSLAVYDTAAAFLAAGARLGCPITLVDAGNDSDAVITKLAGRPDLTLIVSGVGPAAGSDDPALQVIYRIGTTLPGWLTSASTRRTGVVTLTDLTRTLLAFGLNGQPDDEAAADAVRIDGARLQVEDATLTVPAIEDRLQAVAAWSDAALVGYASLWVAGSLLFVALVVGIVLRRFRVPWLVLALGSVLPAGLMLPGVVPWQEADRPGLVVSLLVAGWGVLLTGAAVGLAKLARLPLAVAGAGISVAAFTMDAALGAVLQPGSLINSRPVYGLRWYGFGNVTFAAYATAALLLAGFVAHRLLRAGHRLAAVVAVAVLGLGTVICEGWPSMGSDFGGVIALTPGVLWLLLAISGVRVTWPRVLAIGAAAVLAIGLISWLDWRRGAESRSHLGNFVQRVLDGDATDVVARKAVAAAETVTGPVGVLSILLGIGLWVLMFRLLLPPLTEIYSTLRPVAVAALTTAILGTLLNDGGVYVWLTITAGFVTAVGSMTLDRALVDGHLTWTGRASR